MKAQKQLLPLLSLSLFFGLTTQTAHAFSITPDQPGASETYQYEETWNAPEGQYYTVLNQWPVLDIIRRLRETGKISKIDPGGSHFFRNVLKEQFGDKYRFIERDDIRGSINVNVYKACTPFAFCSIQGGLGVGMASGAAIKLQYNPVKNDNNPAENDPQGSSVHWIQRIISNYDVLYPSNELEFGTVIDDQIHKDRIDVRPGRLSPYYDQSFMANSTLLLDIPYVTAPYTRTNHYAYFETYIVNELPEMYVDPDTGVSKKQVEIYSGVRWGWENTFIPNDDDNYCPVSPGNCTPSETSSNEPPSTPPGGLCLISGEPSRYVPCGSPTAARFSASQAPYSPSELKSVPEPSTAAALLAVGVWAGISWRKRKGEQNLTAGHHA